MAGLAYWRLRVGEPEQPNNKMSARRPPEPVDPVQPVLSRSERMVQPSDDTELDDESRTADGDKTQTHMTQTGAGDAISTAGPDETSFRAHLKAIPLYRRWLGYRYNTRNNDRSFWRDRDPKENEEGRLPDREALTTPAVWVAEVYTPSTVAGLFDGIQRLRWERGVSRNDDLLEWMSQVREGRSAGWTNLGLVSSRDDRHFMAERTAVLPHGVRAVLPRLVSLTPSLTAMLACFILDEEAANALNEPLRQDYTTYIKKRRYSPWDLVSYFAGRKHGIFGGTVHSPDIQRRDRSSAALAKAETRCSDWVSQHLPGAFTQEEHRGVHPTAVLVVTESLEPLTPAVDHVRAFDGIGLNRSYRAWQTDEFPGVRLRVSDSWDEEALRLLFAGRRSDIAPQGPGYHEPESDWTLAQHANDFVPGLLSRWALSCLLDGFNHRLSELRDRTASDLGHAPVRELRQLRRLARTELLDLQAATADIEALARSDRWYRYDVIEPVGADDHGRSRPDLVPSMQEFQLHRSQRLQEDVQRLLTSLSLSAEMTQTISNIRVQRLLVLLTVASVLAALAAVAVTLLADSASQLGDLFGSSYRYFQPEVHFF